MSSETVNSQLDYKKTKVSYMSNPRPQLIPLLPTDSTNLVITASATGTRDIVIPQSVVFNPAESILSCLVTVAASGAGLFNCVFADNALGLINRLEVSDVTGNPIIQINNASQYYGVVFRTETAYAKYLSMGQCRDGPGAVVPLGSYPGIQRRWSLVTAGAPVYSTILRAGATAGPVAVAALDIPASPADILISDAATAMSVRFHVKLDMLCKNTLFQQNKFMYFGQNLTFRIGFNLMTQMVYTVNANSILGVPAVYVGASVTISNLQLLLSVSRNEMVNNQIKDAVNSGGFSVLTGWLRADYLNGTGSATSRQMQLLYSNIDGKRLVKTYIVPYAQTTGAAAAVVAAEQYMHSLLDDTNVIGAAGSPTSYRTTLDTQPLQPALINNAAGFEESWAVQSELYEGSLITSPLALDLYFQHCDNFSEQRQLWSQDISVETGLPLQSQSSIYQFQSSNVAGDCSLYAFSVMQRELLITPSGCKWIV